MMKRILLLLLFLQCALYAQISDILGTDTPNAGRIKINDNFDYLDGRVDAVPGWIQDSLNEYRTNGLLDTIKLDDDMWGFYIRDHQYNNLNDLEDVFPLGYGAYYPKDLVWRDTTGSPWRVVRWIDFVDTLAADTSFIESVAANMDSLYLWSAKDSLSADFFFESGGDWFPRQAALDSLGEFVRRYVGRGLYDDGDSIRIDLGPSPGLVLLENGIALDNSDGRNFDYSVTNSNGSIYLSDFAKFTTNDKGIAFYDTSGTNRAVIWLSSTTNHMNWGSAGLSSRFNADTLEFNADVIEGMPYSQLEGIPSTFTPASHTHVESDITDLDHFTNADETDPVYSAWDKSTGISITESQISDFGTYLTGNQTITLSGDATGSGSTSIAVAVVDDSHYHSSLTITGLTASDFTIQNVSQWTNDANYLTSADLSTYMIKAAFIDSFDFRITDDDGNWKTSGRVTADYFSVIDSAGSPLTMINYVEAATDYSIVGNSDRRLVLKGGNSTDAVDIDDGITNINQLTLDNALNPNYFSAYADLVAESKIGSGSAQVAVGNHTHAEYLESETDPVYSAWDKSTGISITESQISDLDHFTTADETDPVFTAWDKSTGISITESQISDLDHFTTADETDQVFVASSAYGITSTNISNWNTAYSHSSTITGNPHNLDYSDIGLSSGQVVDWTNSGTSTTFYSGNANVTGSFNLTGSAYITSNNYMTVNNKYWYFKNTSGNYWRGFGLNSSNDFLIGQATGANDMHFIGGGGYFLSLDGATKDAQFFGNVTVNNDIVADEIDATWIGENFNMSQINLTLNDPFRLSGNTLVFDYEPTDFAIDGEGYFYIKSGAINENEIAAGTIDSSMFNDTEVYKYIEDHTADAATSIGFWDYINVTPQELTLYGCTYYNFGTAVQVVQWDGVDTAEWSYGKFVLPVDVVPDSGMYFAVAHYTNVATSDDVVFKYYFRTQDTSEQYSAIDSAGITITDARSLYYLYVNHASRESLTGVQPGAEIPFKFRRRPEDANDNYIGDQYVATCKLKVFRKLEND